MANRLPTAVQTMTADMIYLYTRAFGGILTIFGVTTSRAYSDCHCWHELQPLVVLLFYGCIIAAG